MATMHPSIQSSKSFQITHHMLLSSIATHCLTELVIQRVFASLQCTAHHGDHTHQSYAETLCCPRAIRDETEHVFAANTFNYPTYPVTQAPSTSDD